jgi:alanine racemase
MLRELLRSRASQFRAKMPEKRVPARLQKSHHAVTDKEERAYLDQAPDHQIVLHQILSGEAVKVSNSSSIFFHDRSLSKIAREGVALLYCLGLLLLLLHLFFNARSGASALEQKDDDEKK